MDAVDDPVAWQHAVDGFLDSLSSPNTRSAYRTDMAAFARWCALNGHAPLHIGRQGVESFRTQCQTDGAGPSTVARRVAALNGVLPYKYEPSPDPVATTAPTASTTTSLPERDRDVVLDSLAEHDLRTRLLVAMLLLDGLKLDEVLRLDVDHVGGRPPSTVTVGRDGDEHVLPVDPYTAAALAAHLRPRRSGPLLASERGSSGDRRLTRFGADYLLKKVGRTAGLPAPLTANVLRRTHAETAHRRGVSLDEIRRRMGHDDVRTTRRYIPHPPQTRR
jgi:integrase/recombinase XerD